MCRYEVEEGAVQTCCVLSQAAHVGGQLAQLCILCLSLRKSFLGGIYW